MWILLHINLHGLIVYEYIIIEEYLIIITATENCSFTVNITETKTNKCQMNVGNL